MTNTIIFTTQKSTNWGRDTQIVELERIISANKRSLSDEEITELLGENVKVATKDGEYTK